MGRPRFSERIGKRKARTELQIDEMDHVLKNSLWNIIYVHIIERFDNDYFIENNYIEFLASLWMNFYRMRVDLLPDRGYKIASHMRQVFFNHSYLDIYDLIDYLLNLDNDFLITYNFIDDLDYVLKENLAGYRIINNQLAPVSSESEVAAIEEAINNSKDLSFNGASIHIAEALNKLSDRKNPDYRNSIKESISAVESICDQITGDKNKGLGQALKKLDSIMPIHGSLKKGFSNLYGYTSNSDGIRHAMLEADNLDQEDAMYMLVSCSAFVNYLMIKWSKLNQ